MHVTVTSKGGRDYASAATSTMDGARTRFSYEYLGRVVDLERGIFHGG